MSSGQQLKHREFFKIPIITFTLVAIDPLAKDSSDIIRRPFIFYSLYILTLLFVLASIDFCIKNIHDINEFTVAVSLLNQLVIALWKIAIFFGKRQRIYKLIKDIWQWNEKANDKEFIIIASKSKRNALLSKFYYSTVFTTGMIGLTLPLFVKLYKIVKGQEGALEVPHKVSFFWSTSNLVGFLTVYIWDIIIVHFLINASVAIDTLFLWSVSNILIRFSILKKRIENVAEQNQENLFRNFIKDTVKFHLQILHLAKELDSIFGEIIFVKSLVSCTQICFLAFCVMDKNTSAINLLHPLIFLMAVSMQLMLYCYHGHLIEEESLLVSPNIYAAFDWSCLSVPNQKMLQMIMLRSQKSSHITGIFFNLNLNLYLWFFQTGSSLIAVLKTLEDGS